MLLSDLLVLEFAGVLAGPGVGMFLAELGARVVKVENLLSGGDVTRSWRLDAEAGATQNSAYFSSVNWGKESIGLDLKNPAGRRVAQDLVARADIVLVSFKAGDAGRLGLDCESVRTLNSRAIYAEITAYGPGVERTGYDAVIQAETGFMYLNGSPDDGPTKMPVALMDVLAGHQLKEGILLALLERERTGLGSAVSVSLIRSGLATLINQASNWLVAGVNPRRLGSGHPNVVPYGTVWLTADGSHIVLAVGNDRQFGRLCSILGIPEIADDERFTTNPARVVHRVELEAMLGPRIRTRDRTEFLQELTEAEIPAGPIRTVRDALAQPEAGPLLLSSDLDSSVRGVRSVAFEPSETYEPTDLRPPPRLGEHTRDVLSGLLDIDEDEFERMVKSGAVGPG